VKVEVNLLWWNIERDNAQVDFDNVVRAWNNAEQSCQYNEKTVYILHLKYYQSAFVIDLVFLLRWSVIINISAVGLKSNPS